jgi:hypothetical protein
MLEVKNQELEGEKRASRALLSTSDQHRHALESSKMELESRLTELREQLATQTSLAAKAARASNDGAAAVSKGPVMIAGKLVGASGGKEAATIGGKSATIGGKSSQSGDAGLQSEALQAQSRSLQDAKLQLEKQLREIEQHKSSLEQRNATLEKQGSTFKEQKSSLEQKNSDLAAANSTLVSEKSALAAQLAEARETYGENFRLAVAEAVAQMNLADREKLALENEMAACAALARSSSPQRSPPARKAPQRASSPQRTLRDAPSAVVPSAKDDPPPPSLPRRPAATCNAPVPPVAAHTSTGAPSSQAPMVSAAAPDTAPIVAQTSVALRRTPLDASTAAPPPSAAHAEPSSRLSVGNLLAPAIPPAELLSSAPAPAPLSGLGPAPATALSLPESWRLPPSLPDELAALDASRPVRGIGPSGDAVSIPEEQVRRAAPLPRASRLEAPANLPAVATPRGSRAASQRRGAPPPVPVPELEVEPSALFRPRLSELTGPAERAVSRASSSSSLVASNETLPSQMRAPCPAREQTTASHPPGSIPAPSYGSAPMQLGTSVHRLPQPAAGGDPTVAGAMIRARAREDAAQSLRQAAAPPRQPAVPQPRPATAPQARQAAAQPRHPTAQPRQPGAPRSPQGANRARKR